MIVFCFHFSCTTLIVKYILRQRYTLRSCSLSNRSVIVKASDASYYLISKALSSAYKDCTLLHSPAATERPLPPLGSLQQQTAYAD